MQHNPFSNSLVTSKSTTFLLFGQYADKISQEMVNTSINRHWKKPQKIIKNDIDKRVQVKVLNSFSV